MGVVPVGHAGVCNGSRSYGGGGGGVLYQQVMQGCKASRHTGGVGPAGHAGVCDASRYCWWVLCLQVMLVCVNRGCIVPCLRCSIVRETAGGRSARRGAHLLQGRGRRKGRGAKDGWKGGARDHFHSNSANKHPVVLAGGARHLGDSPEVNKGMAGRRPRRDPETGPYEADKMGIRGHAGLSTTLSIRPITAGRRPRKTGGISWF